MDVKALQSCGKNEVGEYKYDGKYVYYEESYEDVFILNNKADAIDFIIKGEVV